MELLEDAAMLVLDGRHGDYALAMAHAARACGIPVLLDAETADRPCFPALLACAHTIVTSASAPFLSAYGFHPSSTSEEDDEDALLKSARGVLAEVSAAQCIVVTRGARGAIALCRTEDGADVLRCAAVPVPAAQLVDTTGAGDAFVAALACALARRAPLPAALRLAAHVSARKCTQLGAHAGTPHFAELPPDLQNILFHDC